jgi:predicted membrane protein
MKNGRINMEIILAVLAAIFIIAFLKYAIDNVKRNKDEHKKIVERILAEKERVNKLNEYCQEIDKNLNIEIFCDNSGNVFFLMKYSNNDDIDFSSKFPLRPFLEVSSDDEIMEKVKEFYIECIQNILKIKKEK